MRRIPSIEWRRRVYLGIYDFGPVKTESRGGGRNRFFRIGSGINFLRIAPPYTPTTIDTSLIKDQGGG